MCYSKLFNFRKSANLIISILLIHSCVPLDQSTSGTSGSVPALRMEDFIYDDDIKSVRLFPFSGSNTDILKAAVIPLSQPFPLMLEFDELYAERENYHAKIIHCNANWKKSVLSDMEFLHEYNEFQINNFQISLNSKPTYVHYKFILPKVKVSGNYIVKVYRGTDENDIVLTRRFMVYENAVNVGAEVGLSNTVDTRNTHQQIDIVVDYNNLKANNPVEEFKLLIRQNQRWDNAIAGIQPTQVREHTKILEYRHFDNHNKFWAGNEFRFFDLRTVNYLGQNVAKIFNESDRIDALLNPDRARANHSYSQYNDINGKYFVETLEPGTGNHSTDGFYVNTMFNLKSERLIGSEVYLLGEFTNWRIDESSRMRYDDQSQSYKILLPLKQGIYNFLYYVKGNHEPYYFEGSHFETENQYEVFVYYRPQGGRADALAGYTTVTYNRRRN